MPLDLPMCRCKLEPYIPSVEEQAQRNRLEVLFYDRPVIEDSMVRRIKNFEKEQRDMQPKVTDLDYNSFDDALMVKLTIPSSAPFEGDKHILVPVAANKALYLLKATRNKDIVPFVPGIKQVIFNNPATIVIWHDGTKTVVKCQPGETFDEEKGLALAISKKALGNKGNYNDTFKRYIKKEAATDEKD